MPDDWDFSIKRRDEQKQPIITFVLVCLCVLLTLAVWYAERSGDVTSAIGRLANVISPSPAKIWDGAYYALLTSFFIHGDAMHIIFNMLWLTQLGRTMEGVMSRAGYLLFLAAAAIISTGCELGVSGHSGIGASGVVYAMFGLMWVGRERYPSWQAIATRHNLNIFLIWGAFCIFGTYAGFMNVANVAHATGLLFGLSVGWLFVAARRKPIWAVPLVLMILLTASSLFWLPWSAEWAAYRGNKAFEAGQYRAAISAYHRSLRLGGDRYLNWTNISGAWHNLGIEAAKNNKIRDFEEATKQEESAAALAGPGPAPASESSASPGIHQASPGR